MSISWLEQDKNIRKVQELQNRYRATDGNCENLLFDMICQLQERVAKLESFANTNVKHYNHGGEQDIGSEE